MRAGERHQLLGAIAVLRSCAVLFAELPFQHLQQARMDFPQFLYLRAKPPPFGVDHGHLIICQDQMAAPFGQTTNPTAYHPWLNGDVARFHPPFSYFLFLRCLTRTETGTSTSSRRRAG